MYIIAHSLNIKPSWKDGVSTHFSDEKGNLALNRKSINLEALEWQVEGLIPSGKEVVVILNADEKVNHGQVIAVMDRGRRVEGQNLQSQLNLNKSRRTFRDAP